MTKDWSLVDINYFSNTQTVALTIFGIVGGVIMRFTQRYKVGLPLLLRSLLRLLPFLHYLRSRRMDRWTSSMRRPLTIDVVVTLHRARNQISRRRTDDPLPRSSRLVRSHLLLRTFTHLRYSSAELVWTQILQGIGGGVASACSQVGAQASVTHGDVAITTALVLLLTEIGGSVGGAIGEYHLSFIVPPPPPSYRMAATMVLDAHKRTYFHTILSSSIFHLPLPSRYICLHI